MYPAMRMMPDERDGDRPVPFRGRRSALRESEDFAYRVELWEGGVIKETIALAATAGTAWAAYYAAMAVYRDQVLALRHLDRVLARSRY